MQGQLIETRWIFLWNNNQYFHNHVLTLNKILKLLSADIRAPQTSLFNAQAENHAADWPVIELW